MAQTTLSPRQAEVCKRVESSSKLHPWKVNEFADGLSRVKLVIVGALAPYDSWLSRIQATITTDPPAAALRKKALNVEGFTHA
jgi:hypothetical protein